MMPRDEMIREYVRSENIAAFTRQLKTEIEGPRRKLLQILLTEQETLALGRPPAVLTL